MTRLWWVLVVILAMPATAHAVSVNGFTLTETQIPLSEEMKKDTGFFTQGPVLSLIKFPGKGEFEARLAMFYKAKNVFLVSAAGEKRPSENRVKELIEKFKDSATPLQLEFYMDGDTDPEDGLVFTNKRFTVGLYLRSGSYSVSHTFDHVTLTEFELADVVSRIDTDMSRFGTIHTVARVDDIPLGSADFNKDIRVGDWLFEDDGQYTNRYLMAMLANWAYEPEFTYEGKTVTKSSLLITIYSPSRDNAVFRNGSIILSNANNEIEERQKREDVYGFSASSPGQSGDWYLWRVEEVDGLQRPHNISCHAALKLKSTDGIVALEKQRSTELSKSDWREDWNINLYLEHFESYSPADRTVPYEIRLSVDGRLLGTMRGDGTPKNREYLDFDVGLQEKTGLLNAYNYISEGILGRLKAGNTMQLSGTLGGRSLDETLSLKGSSRAIGAVLDCLKKT